MTRSAGFSAIAALAAAVLVSCNPTPIPPTVEWAEDGSGFIQFMTYDNSYLNSANVKLYPAANEATMSTVTVTAKKISGGAQNGYGVIFCAQDESNYYKVLIHTNGRYRFLKTVGGTDYPIPADGVWTDTASLVRGYDQPNTISVTRTGPGVFEVRLNGIAVNPINDSASPFNGGQAGFFVYVGDLATEALISDPVDVRFQMTAPVAVP